MATKIRLSRGGAKKRPYYHIVIADGRAPRDGSFIERVGTYDPMLPKDHENRLRVKADRIQHWLSVGAQPTDRVARMLASLELAPAPERREQTKQHQPKAKAQERMAAAEEAKQAAAEAEAAPAEEAPAEEAPAEEAPAEKAPAEEAPVKEAAAEETPAEAEEEAKAE